MKHNVYFAKTKRGMTLAEIILVVAIISIIVVGIGSFQRDIFFYSSTTQADLNAQMEGRRAIRTIVSELREASQSSLGSYPIAVAATSSITFFTDIDNDNLKEQLRYYIQDRKLFKGVIKPTGNPLVYNPNAEVVSTILTDVSNSTSTPAFQYFDTNYAGTSTPLALPVDIPSVRLVKIQLVVDRDPGRSPNPLTITSQVSIRNLKDNL